MQERTDWFKVEYVTEPDYEKKPEYHIAFGNQYPGYYPRIGETLWFHSSNHVKERLKADGMPTVYIVTDICHHITEFPMGKNLNPYTSTSIVVYCVPIEDYNEYKGGSK